MAALPPIAALLLAAGFNLCAASPDTAFVEEQSLGAFQKASRLAVNPQGWMYVADVGKNTVVLIKNDGSDILSVGGYGWTSTTFDRPTGLATDGLNVYISDYGNHRLQRFDRNLNYISSFVTRDTSIVDARFGYPLGVALSRLGDIFVLDGENLRVMKFVENMRFERSFGGIDDQRARLREPIKILVTQDDRVFVLESDRLLEFDYFGNYLRTIGDGTIKDARGFCIVTDGILVVSETRIYWYSGRGDLARVISANDLRTQQPLAPMQDAVSNGDSLCILTSNSIHIFRLQSLAR